MKATQNKLSLDLSLTAQGGVEQMRQHNFHGIEFGRIRATPLHPFDTNCRVTPFLELAMALRVNHEQKNKS
jgi:hypothetical protein